MIGTLGAHGRRIARWACVMVAFIAATVTFDGASANHLSAQDEMSITHSGGNPGPAGGGTKLTADVGSTFTVEVNIGPISKHYNGYQWLVAWEDSIVDLGSGAHTELHPEIFGLCGNPIVDVVGAREIYGRGGGCIVTDPSANYATTFTGMVTSVELQCVKHGTTQVSLLGIDYDSAFGTQLVDVEFGGQARLTTLEPQMLNEFPLPVTVAAVLVSCKKVN